jgi:hypothetical protein
MSTTNTITAIFGTEVPADHGKASWSVCTGTTFIAYAYITSEGLRFTVIRDGYVNGEGFETLVHEAEFLPARAMSRPWVGAVNADLLLHRAAGRIEV